jgi:hypothetical protein
MGREIGLVLTTTGVLHNAGISLSGPDWMDKLHANDIFPIFANFDISSVDDLDTTNSIPLVHVKQVFKNLFSFDIGQWIEGIGDDDMVIVACDMC